MRRTLDLVLSALAAALLCIAGPLTVPLPMTLVPISLTSLALFFATYAVGWRRATAAYGLYLLLGAVGLPVFSGFSGGLHKLAGPTGGYLIGMALIPFITSRFFGKKKPLQAAGLALSLLPSFVLGTAWLAVSLHVDAAAALMMGVVPFLPGDAAKVILALVAGPAVQKRLRTITAG